MVLLAAGLIPGLPALLTTIPQCVIGGTTLSVFAQIAMTGVRMFTKEGLSTRPLRAGFDLVQIAVQRVCGDAEVFTDLRT